MKQKLDQTPSPAQNAAKPAQTGASDKLRWSPSRTLAGGLDQPHGSESRGEILREQRRHLVASTLIPSAATLRSAGAPAKEAEQVSPLQFHIGSATLPLWDLWISRLYFATMPLAVTSALASGAFPTPRTRAAYSPTD